MVVTSETEGLSIAILEAMAFGKPTIATSVGGNVRLVKDKETGMLFECNDDDRLAEILQLIVSKPELIRDWGEKARQLVARDFSLDKTAETYHRLYMM